MIAPDNTTSTDDARVNLRDVTIQPKAPQQTNNANPNGRKQLSQEYLLSSQTALSYFGFLAGLLNYWQGLPRYVDDVERDFGLDIYEKMLHDEAVFSSIFTLKTSILASGYRLTGRVQQPAAFADDPEAQAQFEQSETIREEMEHMLNNLQQPLETVLWEMLDCLAFGHSVAEETYELRDGVLVLKTLRVKPRLKYAFVSDPFLNVVGICPIEMASTVMTVPQYIVPTEKFFILTFNSIEGDPRGRSLLRAAYNCWFLKQQTWPNMLKYLIQFCTPSIAGILPPNAGDVETGTLDADGNPITVTAAQAMLNALQQWANGTAIVVENGTILQPLEMSGTGSEIYERVIEQFDRHITRAILFNARTLMEAEHGSKADSDSSQDVTTAFVKYIRHQVETAFYRDVLYYTVKLNHGEAVADAFTPALVLSDVEAQDLVAYGAMLAQVGFTLHTSQFPGLDAKMNFPERDMDAVAVDAAMEQDAKLQQQRDMANLLNPRGVQPDGDGTPAPTAKGEEKSGIEKPEV